MADKKKNPPIDDDFDWEDSDMDPLQIDKVLDARQVRKVSPLGMRVFVKIRKDSNVSEGGLYLPEGAKESSEESLIAEVIEVASAPDDQSDEELNISGIPNGSIVLIKKNSGVRVPWDDGLRIVETKDVLAIIHEVSLT